MVKKIIVTIVFLAMSSVSWAETFVQTLIATGGSIGQFQDVATEGGQIIGDGFLLGGLNHTMGTAIPSIANGPWPSVGHLYNQSGTLNLDAPFSNINNQFCCDMHGILNLVTPNAPLVLEEGGRASVTSPFTLEGTLTGSLSTFFGSHGPFGNYHFVGHGVMTSEFVVCSQETHVCPWDSSHWTFLASDVIDNNRNQVPEPSAIILVSTGIVTIILWRKNDFTRTPSELAISRTDFN